MSRLFSHVSGVAEFFHQRLFIVLCIFLPTQLGLHVWPDWSFVLGRRIDYLSPTLFFTDVLVVLILLFYGLARGYPAPVIRFRALAPIVILVILNIVFSVQPYIAIVSWIRAIMCLLLIAYIAAVRPAPRVVIPALAAGVCAVSVIAIWQSVIQRSIGGVFWWLGERTFFPSTPGVARLDWCPIKFSGCPEILRAYGTFSHPNVLGGYLATLLPLLLHSVIVAAGPRKIYEARTLVVLAVCIGCIALGTTFSRSAWVMCSVGIGMMWLVSGNRAKFREWMPRIFFSLAAFVACAMSIVSLVHIPGRDDVSVLRRIGLNQSAIEIISLYPLTGTGLGTFVSVVPQSVAFREHLWIQPVHNIFLLYAAETGIIGILIVFLCIRRFGSSGHRTRTKVRFSMLPYVLSIASLLLLGLIDHYPVTQQQTRLLLGILAGLTVSETLRPSF